MKPSASLGALELLVLSAVIALRENAYGVTIRARAHAFAHPKSVSLGAVYAALDRLEEKGLISSWLSDPVAERGGRSRRCYRLEPPGERALRESALVAKRIWDTTADLRGPAWTAS